jgi:O-succinylbenzoate synthase
VRFAFETATLALLARRRGVLPAALLRAAPHERVPLQGLLADGEESAPFARAHVPLKVKVGRRTPEEDRARLVALLDALPPTVALRVDANRSLDLDGAVRLFAGLPPERIEYVEEPLRDPRLVGAFFDRTGLGVALDETMREPLGRELLTHPAVVAVVLKPSVLGGLRVAREEAERARTAGRTAVVSSTFESGIGLEILAQLACAVNGTPVAAGLGTDRWLAEDLLDPSFDSTTGSYAVADWRGRPITEWCRRSGLPSPEAP